jgi:DeoR/GlpR family transcriptional regulator of sugar metabolism
MLARQRHREILTRLADIGAVRVAELADSLGVTEETIRRDLDKLGGEGKLVRTHGGALPIRQQSQDLPFSVRSSAHHAEKESIARFALRHISAHDVIALDASSTVHELARVLPDMPLTVVTNALPATAVLMTRSNIRVFSTGGFLDTPSRSWVGSFAEQSLERVNINKLFLSSKGLDLARGLSEVDDAQARVKRRMMDLAEEKYLLIDHSKFGARSAVYLSQVNDVDVLLTDSGADTALLEEIRRVGVRIETVG